MNDLFSLAAGPYGALALCLSAIVWLVAQWQKCRAALQAEMAARLDDSKATTESLLALNDRIHLTIAQLSAIAKSLRPGASLPPTPTEPTAAPSRLSRPGSPK